MKALPFQFLSVRTLPFLVLLSILALGCGGGNNNTMTSTPAPSPGPGSASPAPTPMPAPNTAGMYQVTLFGSLPPGPNAVKGMVTVNATMENGDGTVQLTGAAASTSYTLSFCPFPFPKYSCFTVTTFTTDATGAAQAGFHIPTAGTWAGDFQVSTGGAMFASTSFDATIATQTYAAALQPESKTNPNGIKLFPIPPTPQDPLTSGRVSIANGSAQVTLTGTVPNSIYGLTTCTVGDGSSCFTQGTLTTDASGNAQGSVPVINNGGGDIILVERSAPPAGIGFIAGFKSQ